MNADDHWRQAQKQDADRRREARWMAVFGAAVAVGVRPYSARHKGLSHEGLREVVEQAELLAAAVDVISPIP